MKKMDSQQDRCDDQNGTGGFHAIFVNERQDSVNATRFDLIGKTGKNYLVQYSSNLTDWTTWTNVTLTDGRCQFSDPVKKDLSQGFYRAVTR